jgi:transcriptional regulator with XRE-family HTH domain
MYKRPEKLEKARRRIKGLLIMRGIEVRELAKQLNCHSANISKVLAGENRSRKIREHICKVLGETYESLWANYPEA